LTGSSAEGCRLSSAALASCATACTHRRA
jgi:hypothetical protein